MIDLKPTNQTSVIAHLIVTSGAFLGAGVTVMHLALPDVLAKVLTFTQNEAAVTAFLAAVAFAYTDNKPGIVALWASLKAIRADIKAKNMAQAQADAVDLEAKIAAAVNKALADKQPIVQATQGGFSSLQFIFTTAGAALAAVVMALLFGCAASPMQTRNEACNGFLAYSDKQDPSKLSADGLLKANAVVQTVNELCQGAVPVNSADFLSRISKATADLGAIYAPAAPASAASK